MRADLIGQSIDGRYEVEALLGEGGMGVVVRARHKFTQESFALKILRPELAASAQTAARFLTEAQAPAAIGHPAIVRVVDAGRTADGDLFLAMDLLRGETLGLRLRAHERLQLDEVERIGLEVLSALGAAHDAGFVHRDLKGENVFLVEPGDTVKLLDFGIAKVLNASGPKTMVGAVIGTPNYMSPEQLRDSGQVDHRADLWAFGVLLFEMLTGALPFRSTGFGELLAEITASPEAPFDELRGTLPPPLEALLRRALSLDLEVRFNSADELAQALREACAAARGAVEPAVASTERAPTAGDEADTARSPEIEGAERAADRPGSSSRPGLDLANSARAGLSVAAARLRDKRRVLLGAGFVAAAAAVALVGVLRSSPHEKDAEAGAAAAAGRRADVEDHAAQRKEDRAERAATQASCEQACTHAIHCGLASHLHTCMTACTESPSTFSVMKDPSLAPCPTVGIATMTLYCSDTGHEEFAHGGTASCRATLACADACLGKPKAAACACGCFEKVENAGLLALHKPWLCGKLNCPSCADGGNRADCARCRLQKCERPLSACR